MTTYAAWASRTSSPPPRQVLANIFRGMSFGAVAKPPLHEPPLANAWQRRASSAHPFAVPRELPRRGSDQRPLTANLRTKILDFRGFDSKQNLNLKGWKAHVHRGFPGNVESANLSKDNLCRGIGRIQPLPWGDLVRCLLCMASPCLLDGHPRSLALGSSLELALSRESAGIISSCQRLFDLRARKAYQ